jgi:predicted alpha/beta superfamily hydrolase
MSLAARRLVVLLLLLSGLQLPVASQTPLSGVVLDADTRQPLPGASLQLRRARTGTTSRPDGSFALPRPAGPDTLVATCLGYALRACPTVDFHSPLLLRHQPVELAPVTVRAQLAERRFGITTTKALLHFTDGSVAAGEAVEIAQLIRLGTSAAVLTGVHLYLATATTDSLSVEVRFYGFDGHRPTRPLAARPVRQRVAVHAGWLRIPLPPGTVQCPAEFVLGLTLRPDRAARRPVPYEIKLGGPARSFARTPTDSAWQVPPHHYRLHVTALVPANLPRRAAEADNAETAATTRLYAHAVQDSFSLFVRLPAGYARHPRRRYPVVLLLDANAYFDQVSEAAGQLPPGRQPLLVGLGYRDVLQMDRLRQRDYLYPAAPPADSLPLTGGGERFAGFLHRELLPYLDQHYRTRPGERTLLGHSFGGYFVLYALLAELSASEPAFRRYVAASPSLGYADQYLLRTLATTPAGGTGRTLYLSFGEQELHPAEAEGAATQAAFAALLRELATSHPALTVEARRYPGASHMETVVPTFTEALQLLGP